MARLWRSFCSIFFIAASISLCGLLIGIFLGNQVAANEFGYTELEVFFLTEEAKTVPYFAAKAPNGLLAIPVDIPKTDTISDTGNGSRNRIDHAEGSIRSQMQMNRVICTDVEFDGTFDVVPGSFLSSCDMSHVRTLVPDKLSVSSKLCSLGKQGRC